MNYISLFSGIGGFDLAFKRVGMNPVAVCEIDKNCHTILRRHFPEAELYDDVRKVGEKTHERNSIDLVCGGFPCQDLSIAGKRAGLAGERSGLWFEFARIIDELEPQWVVAENVPGLLSSNKGGDFYVILRWLAERGYGVAWRVLDAQFFGVPQRRRRVFIVASLGDGRAAEVLFECESLSGDFKKSKEARKETPRIAGTLAANGGGRDRPAGNANELDFLVTDLAQVTSKEHGTRPSEVSQPLNTLGQMSVFDVARSQTSRNQRNDYETENLIAFKVRGGDGQGGKGYLGSEKTPFSLNVIQDQYVGEAKVSPTIESMYFEKRYSNQQFFSQNGDGFPVTPMGVRRLTPTECERLQGFPDGWTEGQSDTVRYRQLGNAVAVPVLEWIGRRIVEANK